MDVRAQMRVSPGFWAPWPKFWAGISARMTPGCPRDIRPQNLLFGLVFRSWNLCCFFFPDQMNFFSLGGFFGWIGLLKKTWFKVTVWNALVVWGLKRLGEYWFSLCMVPQSGGIDGGNSRDWGRSFSVATPSEPSRWKNKTFFVQILGGENL